MTINDDPQEEFLSPEEIADEQQRRMKRPSEV
jgi:hypothetical protein